MKKLLNFFFILFLSLFILSYQNECVKLNGKAISSDPLTSPFISKAFDSDISTYFKSNQDSKGWIGLKLDSRYRITQIGLAFPKDSDQKDYLLGIIEAANEPTFVESEPLYMITEEMKLGEMNYVPIKSSQRYKYIRYIGPNKKYCIISELEIYGDDELGANENAKNDDDEFYYQATNLPLVILQTEESMDPFDKETYINCKVTIIKDKKKETEEKGRVKLRGNATFRLEKRSYRLKFDSKVRLIEMNAKAKSWTLLANHSDKTLLRNILAYKISSLFELKYTPECKPVDLIVNGEYKGNYNLCDQVEEGKGRIEVTEMDQTCVQEPEITGGYVLDADQWAKMGGDSYYETDKGVVYTIKYPDDKDIVEQQLAYIKNYFNILEDECYNKKVDKIDTESFSKYILIEDLCGNGEAFWSCYMTKERSDDKLYFGPVWDFDISFDNDNRIYPVLEKKDFIYKYGTSAGTLNTLATHILSHETTLKKLKEIWSNYMKDKVTKDILINFINDKVEEINESQRLNFIRWDIFNTQVLLNPVLRKSFEEEVDYLKYYIQKRYDILDEIVKNATPESVSTEVPKRGHHNHHKKDNKNINEGNVHNFLLENEE